jgi:hypothetical protein
MPLLDDELLARFAALELAPAEFHHLEHVRLAFVLLARRGDFGEAAVEFRRLLRAFATARGAADRYHETFTWAYLILVHERMARGGYASSLELVAANPDLLDHQRGALARYYDVAAITQSPLARRVFVLPDPKAP